MQQMDPTIKSLSDREVMQLASLGTEHIRDAWQRMAAVGKEIERLGFQDRITTRMMAHYLGGKA